MSLGYGRGFPGVDARKSPDWRYPMSRFPLMSLLTTLAVLNVGLWLNHLFGWPALAFTPLFPG